MDRPAGRGRSSSASETTETLTHWKIAPPTSIGSTVETITVERPSTTWSEHLRFRNEVPRGGLKNSLDRSTTAAVEDASSAREVRRIEPPVLSSEPLLDAAHASLELTDSGWLVRRSSRDEVRSASVPIWFSRPEIYSELRPSSFASEGLRPSSDFVSERSPSSFVSERSPSSSVSEGEFYSAERRFALIPVETRPPEAKFPERCFVMDYVRTQSVGTVPRGIAGPRCYYCREEGHTINKCSKVRCRKCGQKGHIDVNCDTPRCEKCLRWGHSTEGCWTCTRCGRRGHLVGTCRTEFCEVCSKYGHASKDCFKSPPRGDPTFTIANLLKLE
jgi:hypothetical protein